MSLSFSDTSNYRGIIQIFEKKAGFNRGDVSGNTDLLKEVTADVNLAFDEFLDIAFRASGTWQFDDSNHTDYPILTTNLVSSQRDYAFTLDGNSNLILEIYQVFVADSSGVFHEIIPVDVQSQKTSEGGKTLGFYDGRNTTGMPKYYDKTANGIFLDPIPNYNYTNGLKLYINREVSYFVSTDTTKKPGVPGLFHKWFAIRPALDYAQDNLHENFNLLKDEVDTMRVNIEEYFSRRPRDEKPRLVVTNHDNR